MEFGKALKRSIIPQAAVGSQVHGAEALNKWTGFLDDKNGAMPPILLLLLSTPIRSYQ